MSCCTNTFFFELLILIANALDVSADDLLTDSLKHSSSQVGTEIHDLLLDCNHDSASWEPMLSNSRKVGNLSLHKHTGLGNLPHGFDGHIIGNLLFKNS